ncbi:unnamed protein product [Penicillium glandicola]
MSQTNPDSLVAHRFVVSPAFNLAFLSCLSRPLVILVDFPTNPRSGTDEPNLNSCQVFRLFFLINILPPLQRTHILLTTMSSKVTPSGIVTDDQTGERYVPSSVRPDGTKRKEIRIRPGYQLEEDIERYKCPARRVVKQKLQEQDQLSPVQTCDSIDTKTEVGKTASSKNLDKSPTSTHKSKTGIWTATLSHRSAKSSAAEQNLRTAGKTKKATTACHKWPKHSDPPQRHQLGENV